MHPLFNEQPNISYFFNPEEHQDEMDQGYASAIATDKKRSVLVFKDVDDHYDGNGLAILWLIKGQGIFYLDGEAIKMETGDVIMFDDNIEHGFEAPEICMAMNILIDKEYTLDEAKALIKEINSPQRKPKP